MNKLKITNGMVVILPAHPSLKEEKTTIVSITEKGTHLKDDYLELWLGAYGLSLKEGKTLASSFNGSLNHWVDLKGKVNFIDENTLFLEGYGNIKFFPINYQNSVINEIKIILKNLDNEELHLLKNIEMLVPKDVKYMSHSIKNDPGAICDQRVLYKMEDAGGYMSYIKPGVKTHELGKNVIPIHEVIDCYSNLDKICYTDNLDLIIRQYFPEGTERKIKNILKIQE